jgi:hypothetical protein
MLSDLSTKVKSLKQNGANVSINISPEIDFALPGKTFHPSGRKNTE